jgi:hypothetical protein
MRSLTPPPPYPLGAGGHPSFAVPGILLRRQPGATRFASVCNRRSSGCRHPTVRPATADRLTDIQHLNFVILFHLHDLL